MSADLCACGCDGTCGCGSPATPPDIGDPLAFRHSAILRRMTDGLSGVRIAGRAPLAGWTSRAVGDPGMALLDAQAGALHVLAWNVNRLWADGALPTSEDPQALAALGRLLGHAARPALAATTVLSLDMDDIAAAPEVVDLPQGLKIASVPLKDTLPQTFETDAPLQARKAWNRLYPVRGRTDPPISVTTAALTLAGPAPRARAGDLVLVFAGGDTGKWLSARILSVDRPAPATPTAPIVTVLGLASQALVACQTDFADKAFRNQVILLGDRAAAFGATAADLSLFSTAQLIDIGQMAEGAQHPADWSGLVMTTSGTADGGTIDLAAVHDQAMAGKAVLFAALGDSPPTQMGKITAVQEGARNGFGLSGKVSRVTVSGVNLDIKADGFAQKVRETTIHIETVRERLQVPDDDTPIPNAATPDRIVVQGLQGFEAGRHLILFGMDWLTGAPRGETVILARAEPLTGSLTGAMAGPTELIFTKALTGAFHAEGLQIHGNCVSVSQGETPHSGPETLGQTNPGAPLPRYRLKGGAVAEVPAATPNGYAPALTVRVGARAYDRVDSLFGLAAGARVYRFAPDTPLGPIIEFAGPLPPGQAVTASYRKGGGAAGNLAAGRLTTVMTPVPGLRGATNPFATAGGSEAEGPDDLRRALPASVRTLGRAVALTDVESFALAYRGVGKALASELRQGMRRVLCLTLADGAFQNPVPGSDLLTGLAAALAAASPPGRAIRIAGFESRTATVAIAFAHDPALDRAGVEAGLRAVLLAAFSPAVRPFGRALHQSDLLAAAQNAPGVVAARLVAFALPDGPPPDAGRLLCPLPRFEPSLPGGPETFRPAGLIALSDASLTLTEMQP